MRSKLIPKFKGKIRPMSFYFIWLILIIVILTGIFAQVSFNKLTDYRLHQIESQQSVRSEPVIEPYSELTEEVVQSTNEFVITHYCACEKCCGKSDKITKSGTVATINRTVAVDPAIIEIGTELTINGQKYIAEDTGAFKGYQVDIYVESHEEAINLGTYVTNVSYIEVI